MKTGIIIQARMGSTRLPGKVLADLEGKSVLARVIERCKRVEYVDTVMVATTTLPADNKTTEEALSSGADSVFRGEAEHVLDRYYQAAKEAKLDTIVRITADCPLLDPQHSSFVVGSFLGLQDADYVSNVHPPTMPDGLDTEVFSFGALEKAWHKASLAYEWEHVTPYIWNPKNNFKVFNLQAQEDLSCHRWTLDYKADLIFCRQVYSKLGPDFTSADVLSLVRSNPKLLHTTLTRNKTFIYS